MSKIISITPPVEKNEVYFFLSDIHSFDMDKKALKVFMKYVLDCGVPPEDRYLILGGDILDCNYLYEKCDNFNRAVKHKDFDDYFIPKVQEEIAWFESLLEELSPIFPTTRMIFMEGNHEQRAERKKFRKSIPCEYAHWFDWKQSLGLKKKGILHLRYNDWLKIHGLYITHGQACGANPIKKHQVMANASVLFGHTHEIGVVSFKNISETYIGYNNPCFCDLEASYMENKTHNWSVGFTEINVTPKKAFVNVHNIWNDELIINGNVYSGK